MIQIETILDILVKGFVIGIVVSAPLGPVGVLCIQRTLNKGRWYGFVTGLGASLSDIAYALLTGYGMSFVFDYINKNIFYLQLLGSIMLLVFGIYTFRSNPVQSIRPVSANKGSYFHNFITAFAESDGPPSGELFGREQIIVNKTGFLVHIHLYNQKITGRHSVQPYPVRCFLTLAASPAECDTLFHDTHRARGFT